VAFPFPTLLTPSNKCFGDNSTLAPVEFYPATSPLPENKDIVLSEPIQIPLVLST